VKSRSILLIVFCSVLLTSCIPSTKLNPPSDGQPQGTLTSINISLYRIDSVKPQPELIEVEVDPGTMDSAVKEIKDAEPANLPEITQLEQIYFLQFSYETNGTVVKTEYYMYIIDDRQNHYIKPFELTSDYSVNTYDPIEKDAILRMIGADNWKKLSLSVVEV
jgi:hypothetical protein